MPWVVTIKVTDCGNGVLLQGASMWDGSQTVFTDVNGQVIWYIDDVFTSYTVQISKTGYDSKTFVMVPSMNGSIQTVCLMVHLDTTCFTGDTRVTLADGSEKPIAQIRAGDWVLGREGRANRVLEVDRTVLGQRRLFGVGGAAPFVTAEHPFMTEEGWKAIDPSATAVENRHLVVGRLGLHDRVVVLQACGVLAGHLSPGEAVEPVLGSMPVNRIEPQAGPADMPLYNLILDGDHAYFANDFLVHNKGTTDPVCFIVSATTGSSRSVEVAELRGLRDRVASASRLGAQLIDAIYDEYFRFSPQIAAELEQDLLARKAVLWAIVRPLLAWYRLGGVLAFDPANREELDRGARELVAACPRYLGGASILAALEAIRDGRELPGRSSRTLREFEPRIREAARLPFASWAILEPLVRVWRAVVHEQDVVGELSEWLATAPIESVARPGTPQELEREIGALSRFYAFSPEARQRLGGRLMTAWPEAAESLKTYGFVN